MARYDVHVLPVNDLREHEQTRTCWCKPRVTREDKNYIIVHASLDGRELVEAHGVN